MKNSEAIQNLITTKKEIVLIGSFGFKRGNAAYSELPLKIIETCFQQPAMKIEDNFKPFEIKNSTLVFLAQLGSRDFLGVMNNLGAFVNTCVSDQPYHGYFKRFFTQTDNTTNTIGAIIVEMKPSKKIKVSDLLKPRTRFADDNERMWWVNHFANPQDPAFADKNPFYDFDPSGTYCKRRVFCVETLRAAIDPDYLCSDTEQHVQPEKDDVELVSGWLQEVQPYKYTRAFLNNYLEQFSYALKNPFTPTSTMISKPNQKSCFCI
jgi:hypothetical protein